MPTLGGRQFWADELFFHDWHIQRNVFTGHCRLLDGANRRHAWGSFAECQDRLAVIRRQRALPAMQGTAAILLHGLFRSASSMSRMARYLREQGGYTVFNVNYPTTRRALADHARQLGKIIAGLQGIERIHFVAHSLGNLVIRHYLGDQTNAQQGLQPDRRIGRIVMLAPPNQAPRMAEVFFGAKLMRVVGGASVSQLSREWASLEPRLIVPACPFGILAGGGTPGSGYHPVLQADNDLVVSVDSTRLAGAVDFAVVPVIHTFIMDDCKVQEYTLRFLEHGYFKTAPERQPIEPEAPRST